MTHEALDSSFNELIDVAAPVTAIGTGFEFTEGPIWHPIEQFLFFSDMPGDVRRGYDPESGVSEIMRPSNKGNGMTYDADLNLLVCEHATSSVARFTPDGQREVLASHFEGKELNSPNDIVVQSDGAIWFTDPTYGRMPGFGVEREVELGFQGVYRIPPGGGAPQLMVNRYSYDQPNGLCFSPDESKLYVNDTVQTNIRVYDVAPDGTLTNERVLASGISDPVLEGVPDGMKCDAKGNIWVTAPGGIWIYAPSGYLLGKVRVPENTANFHWGGGDWRTLYACATSSVYEIPVKVGPHVEPFMRNTGAQSTPAITKTDSLDFEPGKAALIIQDMQNDVVIEGGAFAESGAPAHCTEQNAIANIASLARACRSRGIPVIHVWFIVDPGCPGLTMNAPLFQGVLDENALLRGSWGAAPVQGLEPEIGDFIVEKSRMSPWDTSRLETVLRARGVTTLINTGAWTNMSVEHTARTGADKGYVIISPEDACSTMNADWHRASMEYATQNVAQVTDTQSVLRKLGITGK
ncbi:MAG: isochorismatase family protein [Rhodobacteraceae bacterium]|nr:isochorismatase family protein [Paracoccaceae bacterium]